MAELLTDTELSSRPAAVVSGAGSGIGKATVSALAEVGYAVVGIDLAAAPGELANAAWLDWVQGDVTAQDTWDEALVLCQARDPQGPSAFVACAATISVGPFLQSTVDEWRHLFEVNVLGVLRGMHALTPSMVERGGGAVAITCSVSSLFGEQELASYASSKAALLSLTKTAALELAGLGVRINAVCPGSVDTPLLRQHAESLDDPEAALAAMRRRVPVAHLTRPEEIAALLTFLVSDDASALAGAAVVADGGLTIAYEFAAP